MRESTVVRPLSFGFAALLGFAVLAWSQTPPPKRVPSGHSATLLGDGRVLVAGGNDARDEAEVFDMRTGAFTSIAKMLVPRSHHTATLLLSGKVLFAGGDNERSAELFDPVTSTFAATGALGVVRSGHGAVRLADGRVLLAGGVGDLSSNDASAELYDPAAGTFTATPPRSSTGHGDLVLLASGKALFLGKSDASIFDPAAGSWTPTAAPNTTFLRRTVVRLRDDRVLCATPFPLVGGSGPSGFEIFDPAGAGSFGPLSGVVTGLSPAMGGALLPSGTALFAGGVVSSKEVVLYDPSAAVASLDDAATVPHRDAKATVLPGGDVLVVGGDVAAADLRTWPGSVAPTETALALTTPRMNHMATLLLDGRILVVGGWSYGPIAGQYASSEIVDPVAKTSIAAGSMSEPRWLGASVLLASGKVLVVGGGSWSLPSSQAPVSLASAEVFDPATGQFHVVGSMTVARRDPGAVRLPSGEVLVVGGCSVGTGPGLGCGGSGANSAEIFDPSTETFRSIGATLAHGAPGLVRLPNGLVMVVDGAPEIFDPKAMTFRGTKAPLSDREGPTARVLPNGKVFVGGGAAATNQIFDPVSETWSSTGAMPFTVLSPATWGMTPSGALLLTGGRKTNGVGAESRMLLFDPLASGGAPALAYDGPVGGGRHSTTVTVAPTVPRLLVAGGCSGGGQVLGNVFDTALLYGDGAPNAARPILDAAPAEVTGGASVTIHGTGFASSSSGAGPLAFWIPDAGDAVVPSVIRAFSDTSAEWVAPPTALAGRGWLYVSVDGVASRAVPVAVAPAQPASACRFGAECASGACADGVCCDRTCDQPCEACSAKRKGSGPDGTCATIPFGQDACKAPLAKACTMASECASGFCASGVCCDSACTGACLSCIEPDSAGVCRAIPFCDLACDGDHTLKKQGAPDVDCAPYTCDGAACRTRCASVAECAPPAVCALDGTCIPLAAAIGATVERQTLLGCSLGRLASSSTWLDGRVAAAWLVLGALLARRARRARRVRRRRTA